MISRPVTEENDLRKWTGVTLVVKMSRNVKPDIIQSAQISVMSHKRMAVFYILYCGMCNHIFVSFPIFLLYLAIQLVAAGMAHSISGCARGVQVEL